MGDRKRHDWLAIRTEYITTNASQRDLAAKFEVPESVIGTRAEREKWVERREHYRRRTEAETLEAAVEREVERRISALELCDSIIAQFMAFSEVKNITAFDAMNAARFREVLQGGVSDRTQSEVRDWRQGLSEVEIKEIEDWANGAGVDRLSTGSGDAGQ